MKKGFTLIELMIVIAIIALLASIAVPKLGGIKEDAKAAEVQSTLAQMRTGIAIFFAKNDTYPTRGNGANFDFEDNAGSLSADMQKYSGLDELPLTPNFTGNAANTTDDNDVAINAFTNNGGYVYFTATTTIDTVNYQIGDFHADLPDNTFGIDDWETY